MKQHSDINSRIRDMDFYKRSPELLEEIPSNRQEAKEAEVSKYYTGKACKSGHVAPRNTVDSSCCECRNIQKDANKAKRRSENKDEEIVPEPGEVFKDHPTKPHFIVSNKGRVYRKRLNYSVGNNLWSRAGAFASVHTTRKGYLTVSDFNDEGKKTTAQVHRLVAQTFIENPDDLPEVNHKNGIKTDNSVENLEWMTTLDNVRHAWASGLCKAKSGVDHSQSKLTEDDVRLIRCFYEFRHPCWNSVSIAKHMGISQAVVSQIANFETWKHVI